ncbi:MAG: HAD family hydrolase [Chloroflexi bacterium]|nr:HAD family hydrolase [Chloroflexota bacterium]
MEAIPQLRCILFDVDGVVYLGSTPLPGSQDLFDLLEQRGIPYALITNNATRTPRQYVEKLAQMGIRVPERTVFTSGVATAMFLKRLEPRGAPVYLIGQDGLVQPMLEAGFWLDERRPKYVVVGLDMHLTYAKLRIACLAIRAGATFIGANPDKTLPTEEGLLPGCGSILAALETATDVSPRVIGKPSADMIDLAVEMLGADKARTVIVGDRWDTDILAGQRAGIGTMMVLTGVTRPEDLPTLPVKPDVVLPDLVEFARLLMTC